MFGLSCCGVGGMGLSQNWFSTSRISNFGFKLSHKFGLPDSQCKHGCRSWPFNRRRVRMYPGPEILWRVMSYEAWFSLNVVVFTLYFLQINVRGSHGFLTGHDWKFLRLPAQCFKSQVSSATGKERFILKTSLMDSIHSRLPMPWEIHEQQWKHQPWLESQNTRESIRLINYNIYLNLHGWWTLSCTRLKYMKPFEHLGTLHINSITA